MANRDFKGVWVPKEVWLDERLNALEKVILTEIDSLDNGKDHCFISNEKLAEFCQCSVTKVSTGITKLKNLGYIKIHSFDGRTRKLESCLSKSESQTFKNCKADFQKVKDNNISINPTINTSDYKNTSYSPSDGSKSSKNDIPEDFTKFYSAYPRKVAKQLALKAWKSLKPNAETVEKIVADVHRRCDTEWRSKEMQYIPHPATYLKQRRWEDETAPTAQSITPGNPNSIYADMDTSSYFSKPF